MQIQPCKMKHVCLDLYLDLVDRGSLLTQLKFWWCPKSSNVFRHCL